MKVSINILLDRSGSMSVCRESMEKGLKEILEKQKEDNCPNCSDVRYSLAQFDDVYEEVFLNKRIDEVKDITITPRGWTALYDSLGKFINSVSIRNKEFSPDKTLFIVITDGFENASKEYTAGDIKKLIQGKEKNGYEFVYVGANQDSFLVGDTIGIRASNIMNYKTSDKGIRHMSGIMGNSISAYCVNAGTFNDISKHSDD